LDGQFEHDLQAMAKSLTWKLLSNAFVILILEIDDRTDRRPEFRDRQKIAKRFHRVIIGLANECRTNHMKAMLAKGFQR